jgi:hypothetical protein
MKKIFSLSLLAFITVTFSFAQNVAINADATLPNSSAMLDVKSTNKGLLIPRVALTGTGDITTIPSPATSLMVYNSLAAGTGATAVVPGYYYWDGSWVRMVAQKGGAVPFADFYALMPPDNPGGIYPFNSGLPLSLRAINFPRTDISNSIITRNSAFEFILPDIATYEITFQASIDQPAQLAISLNGAVVPSSVVGRSTAGTQIVGTSLITTTIPNSTLSIINNTNNSLSFTPSAGQGNSPVSAHLIIKKLN